MEVNTLNAIYTAIVKGMVIGILPEYLINYSIKIIEPFVLRKKLYLCTSNRISQITSGSIVIEEIKRIMSNLKGNNSINQGR